MAGEVALDTDVLLKAAAYRISAELCSLIAPIGPPALLGLTHLIAEKQLQRSRRIADRDGARAELRAVLPLLGRLEPEDDEIALSAEITAAAQLRGLPLDAGEAQLMAILISRNLPLLVTGDKRALTSLAILINMQAVQVCVCGRLACFEQVVAGIGSAIDTSELRARVCREPQVDGAMSLIFCCGRDPWQASQLSDGCASFIKSLREQVGDLLTDQLPLA